MSGVSEQSNDSLLFERFFSPNLYTYFRVKRPEIDANEMRIRLTELLKFLILSHEFPGNILFGEELDDLWHLWIMQTREYEKLCCSLPSGRFIHHDSRDQPSDNLSWAEVENLVARMIADKKAKGVALAGADLSPQRLQENAERLLSFFASYIENFGEIRPEVVSCWPPLPRLMLRMGWSTDDLNAFLTRHSVAGSPPPGRPPVRHALPA
ncbi:MAG: hypothetical protein ING72_02030 [Methylobacterium sp.]|nr:hypothetical protein [Methylobacterium sp.]